MPPPPIRPCQVSPNGERRHRRPGYCSSRRSCDTASTARPSRCTLLSHADPPPGNAAAPGAWCFSWSSAGRAWAHASDTADQMATDVASVAAATELDPALALAHVEHVGVIPGEHHVGKPIGVVDELHRLPRLDLHRVRRALLAHPQHQCLHRTSPRPAEAFTATFRRACFTAVAPLLLPGAVDDRSQILRLRPDRSSPDSRARSRRRMWRASVRGGPGAPEEGEPRRYSG